MISSHKSHALPLEMKGNDLRRVNTLCYILSVIQTSQERDHTSGEKKKLISPVRRKCSFWTIKVVSLMSACEQNMTDDHGELFMGYHDGLIYGSCSEHPPVPLTDLILKKDSGGYCSPVTFIMISTQGTD